MDTLLLKDIVVIFGLAIAVLFVFHWLRLPTVVGFLLTGVVVGPNGLGLVSAVREVEILAEIGVVSLLFTIGIDFSLERLLETRKSVLMGGSLQVVLTALATFFIAGQLGRTLGEALFIGFLVALSSTAIVLRLLQERAEVDSPHGRATLGILIFQDIIIVPMILITPLLAGAKGDAGLTQSMLVLLFKGAVVILLVIVGAKWIVPRLLYQITKTRQRELFLLSVVLICLGVAWLTSKAGLSLALGGFLAGLIISESEYSHHTLGNILPFRDVFTTFFFVSIGMLLDVGFLLQQPAFIVLIVVGVIVMKATIAGSVTILLGFPLRTAIMVGLALGQIGEFSFILSRVGLDHDLLTGNAYQVFLAVSVLSMAATPFVIGFAPRAADIIMRWPVGRKLISGFCPISETKLPQRKDHLIIIGFGVNGKNVARAARVASIPYAIIEMNPETVRSEHSKGEPIYCGDATQEPILQHANLKEARIVVVAINDPTGTRRIVEAVRRLNRTVHLIVRTRYVQEMGALQQLGADEVIPEEFETSVEIFTRVLTKYLVPTDEIEMLIANVRADGYQMLRSLAKTSSGFADLKLQLPDLDVGAFRISAGSPLVRKTLAQLDMRRNHGIFVVAIRRDSRILSNPEADTLLQCGDVVFLVGSRVKLSEAARVFSSSHKGKRES